MIKTIVLDYAGDNFSVKIFEDSLRALPPGERTNLRQLRFKVHPDVYMDYIQSVASRQGDMANMYLSSLVGDPTYGGVPVSSHNWGTGDPQLTLVGAEGTVVTAKNIPGRAA